MQKEIFLFNKYVQRFDFFFFFELNGLKKVFVLD